MTDTLIRQAAFAHIQRLSRVRDYLSSDDLKAGFSFNGERIPLVNPQRGIFKPRQMEYLLSIRTVFPKPGAKIWYDDQRGAHKQFYDSEETVDYAFMGQDPNASDNRWLKAAYENQIPIIYFLGKAPGQYEAVIPTFVQGWDSETLNAKIAFGEMLRDEAQPPTSSPERRYALREVKQRLHQGTFRQAVIYAYKGRCALSGLPEKLLLDAAHIISDKDEMLGHPIVQNGIPLSKIHHAAFDAHLIGIDPDYRLYVSDRLMVQNDGPMLDAMKLLHGGQMHLPERRQDWPDRERLAQRFEIFKNQS